MEVGAGGVSGGGSSRAGRFLTGFLSYKTTRQVKIADKRLGAIYYIVGLAVVAYIIVYVFIVCRGYNEVQYTEGLVATKIKSYAVVAEQNGVAPPSRLFFDGSDIVDPPLEPGAFFITTRLQRTEQTYDWCHDPMVNQSCTPATMAADCGPVAPSAMVEMKCNTENICDFYQWCPLDPQNTNLTLGVKWFLYPKTTEYLFDLSLGRETSIWVKGSIVFDKLGGVRYTTITDKKPINNTNSFTLSALLAKEWNPVTNSPVALEDVNKEGGIFRVELTWDCNVQMSEQSACSKAVSLRRLDDAVGDGGFNYRTAIPADPTTRVLYKYYGLRFFVISNGSGYRASLVQIMLTIASGIALFSIASIFTDFVLLFILPRLRGKQKSDYTPVVVEEVDKDHIPVRVNSVCSPLLDGEQ